MQGIACSKTRIRLRVAAFSFRPHADLAPLPCKGTVVEPGVASCLLLMLVFAFPLRMQNATRSGRTTYAVDNALDKLSSKTRREVFWYVPACHVGFLLIDHILIGLIVMIVGLCRVVLMEEFERTSP